jgi:hypothetical protein
MPARDRIRVLYPRFVSSVSIGVEADTVMRLTLQGSLEPLETDVPNVWDIVRTIRDTVAERLSSSPPALRDAVIIAAAELAENVLKYSAEDGVPPMLSVEMQHDRALVKSENDVGDAAKIDAVLALVERIRDHADPVRLYAESIEARLSGDPSDATQQGLYRIAAVAEFSIDARREGRRLFISAQRRIR